MKDPFAPYIHLFLLFESLSFLLIQGSARILAGGLTQRKEATFCQQRGYFLVYGPATPPIPQIAFPACFFSPFLLLYIFFSFANFLRCSLLVLRAEWNARSRNPMEGIFFSRASTYLFLSLSLFFSFYFSLSFFSH